MIDMNNTKSSQKNIALSQSPISIIKTELKPQSQILISQVQSQIQSSCSKSQQNIDAIEKKLSQKYKILKFQLLISSVFTVFLILEIIIICKKSWYNPDDIPQCQKQMFWTIAAVITKFLFVLNVIISWRLLKSNQNKSQQKQLESINKRRKTDAVILLICIASIIGQFVQIKYHCGILQISLIVLGTIVSFICLMGLLIIILKKIV